MQEKLSQRPLDFLYDVRMEIKEWITTSRKGAHLTQDQLAEALDVTRGNVSAWENGRHEPSLSQLQKIATLCRTTVLPLFGLLEKSESNTWPFTIAIDLFMSLPVEEQERIDDDLKHTVERWHTKNHMKSKKIG